MSIRHRGNFYLSLFHLLDLVIYSEEALLWNFTSRRILFNRQNSLRTPPKERPRPIVSLCNWVGSFCGMMDPSDYLRPPAPSRVFTQLYCRFYLFMTDMYNTRYVPSHSCCASMRERERAKPWQCDRKKNSIEINLDCFYGCAHHLGIDKAIDHSQQVPFAIQNDRNQFEFPIFMVIGISFLCVVHLALCIYTPCRYRYYTCTVKWETRLDLAFYVSFPHSSALDILNSCLAVSRFCLLVFLQTPFQIIIHHLCLADLITNC